jgi:hypothetical protein
VLQGADVLQSQVAVLPKGVDAAWSFVRLFFVRGGASFVFLFLCAG